MADIALIIGNGFDIDLGLPSRYSDFVKSKEWDNVVKGVNTFLQLEDYRRHSLIGQLQLASKESKWFDIEEEIHKFVISHPDNTDEAIGEIKSEFEAIKNALANYLKRISKRYESNNIVVDDTKLSAYLLSILNRENISVSELFFNYTSPHSFIEFDDSFNEKCTLTYVHGKLDDGDIVLGCDLQPGEEVNRQLSFMYKYNMLNKANHVARDILEAKVVIFFGHSINEMDFGYFREYFKAASASPHPARHLTIITYDEQSERAIKDNIRNQGISVTDLYNNLESFDFVHTTGIYNHDYSEQIKMSDLIDRIYGCASY